MLFLGAGVNCSPVTFPYTGHPELMGQNTNMAHCPLL